MKKLLVLVFALLCTGAGVAQADPATAYAQVVPVMARDVAGGSAVGVAYEGRQPLPVPCCEEVRPVEDWSGASPFGVGLRVLSGGVDQGFGGVAEHFRLVGPDGGTLYWLLGAESSVGCTPDGGVTGETRGVLVKTAAGDEWVVGDQPHRTAGVPVGDGRTVDFELTRVTGAAQVAEFLDVWPADVSTAAGWVLDARVGSADGGQAGHYRYLLAAGYCFARTGDQPGPVG